MRHSQGFNLKYLINVIFGVINVVDHCLWARKGPTNGPNWTELVGNPLDRTLALNYQPLHSNFSVIRYRCTPLYQRYQEFTVSVNSHGVSLFIQFFARFMIYSRFRCSSAINNFKKLSVATRYSRYVSFNITATAMQSTTVI